MFESLDEAIRLLNERFKPAEVAVIEKHIRPALGFKPLAGGKTVIGGTRLGGVPDLPDGIDWPMRRAFAKDHPAMTRGGPYHAEHIEKYALTAFPMAFYAQIDLAEAHRVSGDTAKLLPETGRLLFFYEIMTGSWLDGPLNGAGAVIYDDSPASALKPRPTPQALKDDEAAQLEAMRERQAALKRGETPDYVAELTKAAGEMANAMVRDDYYSERYGWFAFAPKWLDALRGRTPWRDDIDATEFDGSEIPPEDLVTRFEAPSQPIQLKQVYTLPSEWSYDRDLDAGLDQLFSDDDNRDAYEALVEWGGSRFNTTTGGDPTWLNRALGHASPVQSDPRSGALFEPEQIRSRPHDDPVWKRQAATRAMDYILLLQVDNATLTQSNAVEGVVYFYIHKDDLAKRDFSKVTAVYQTS